LRSTTLGTALLSVSIVFAFVSVLFSNISFSVAAIALVAAQIYSYRKFVNDIETTDLKIERKVLDQMMFSMEPTSIAVEVLNRSSEPVRGTFEDIIPEDCVLSSGSNKTSMILPERSILRLSYSITPQKRGTYNIPGMKIERTDSHGLFVEEQVIQQDSHLSVHTEKRAIDIARKMAGREHLEFSGVGKNPAIVLREFEFDGIREYQPGDRARDIHWKLLSKLNRLMTKTYRKEGAVHTTIFLDCGRSMRLQSSKVAKLNHGVDISMQLSNVLINSFHPAGVATFDEMRILNKIRPSVSRHQFDRIVKLLMDVPGTIEDANPSQTKKEETLERKPKAAAITSLPEGGRKEFLSSLAELSTSKVPKRLGIGLEGGIKEILAKNMGQEQLFIIISDLISSRNAVLAGARICKTTGNKMLIIHTYDDWYRESGQMTDAQGIETLYDNISGSIKLEAAFRGYGASYIRIGPADTTSGIVRAIRRGRT